MPDNRLDLLFERYLNRTTTDEEYQELMQLLQQPDNEAAVKQLLDQLWAQLAIDNRLPAGKADALFASIMAADRVISVVSPDRQPVRRLFIKRIAVAAAILMLISTGWWFYYNKFSKPVPSTSTLAVVNDIPPGRNNALLILADGRRINLDSAANGNVAEEGSTVIRKRDGQILYDAADRQSAIGSKQSATPLNTVSTARGNQYKLILPDGSAVWLNAESSVRFPVAFTGRERRIEVTGEVYVEVKHNAAMPFMVVANGVEVRDIGTQFDVSSYSNEGNIVTTVVEGKVEVVKRETAKVNKESAILTPGHQGVVSAGSGSIQVVQDADVDAVIAWKNGQFMFAGNNIQSVMRQLERWYDIEVSYAPNISREEFVGTMTRYANISSVLKMLEKTGTVHFEIQGRRVMVK
jgi:transmembrane sensor